MNQQRPVPRLDLAPHLRHPLSRWNPLDYLRLLYWVFFFPQALRWYLETFGGAYIPKKEMSWREERSMLLNNDIQRKLLLQGVILTVVTPVAVCLVLQEVGLRVDWWGVGLFVGLFAALGVAILRPESWLMLLCFNSLTDT